MSTSADVSCGRPRISNPNVADTRMSDGRHFTDWTPRGSGWMIGAAFPHPAMANPKGPLSSHDMKDMLVDNGNALMKADREAAAASVSRVWCDALAIPGFSTEQECGEFSCAFAGTAQGAPGLGPGLGLGRK